MMRLERLLFYPAVLAATVFVTREALTNPSNLVWVALAMLAVIWLGAIFRTIFWFARLVFWLAFAGGLGVWLWMSAGTTP